MMPRHSLRSVLVISLILTVTQVTVGFASYVLYGVSNGRSQAPAESSLYVIDPRDGAATLIGPIGFDNVDGLAFLGDGRLVGAFRADAMVANPESPGTPVRASGLIEIHPATGAGTFIGLIGDSLTGCGRVSDLAYDPATDTLYGYADTCLAGLEGLIVVDQITGAGASVGTDFPVTDHLRGGGLAIDLATETIYATPSTIPAAPFFIGGPLLLSIDPTTGVADLLNWQPVPYTESLATRPGDPLLYGSIVPPRSEPQSYLTWFDPVDIYPEYPYTGIQASIDDLDGLVFGPGPPPTLEVPTLGKWGIAVLAGVLAALAVTVLRRRPHDGVLRS